MDEKSAQQIFSLAGSRYAHILTNLNNQNRNRVKRLLSNRQMPERGWNNSQILQLLSEIASLDQNNLESNVGVGDREGRVFSSLVASRSYQMAHGMGRSGDIIANQPKALGSSIIVHLTNILAKSLVKTCCGIQCKDCFVLPVATGMALSLTLKAIYKLRPSSSKTKCALWCRVDQKTCFKAIIFSGFKPIVVENVLDGDQVISNVAAIETLISSYLHRTDYSIDCVVTVTSCFAPRAPDSIIEISRLCEKFNIAHVVNNAFGLQSTSICSLINRASKSGRLDAVVQSTDKNIMVPVGGSIVATFKTGLKEEISMCYPGRASISPLLDTCITLLSMGQNSWKRLVSEREVCISSFSPIYRVFFAIFRKICTKWQYRMGKSSWILVQIQFH